MYTVLTVSWYNQKLTLSLCVHYRTLLINCASWTIIKVIKQFVLVYIASLNWILWLYIVSFFIYFVSGEARWSRRWRWDGGWRAQDCVWHSPHGSTAQAVPQLWGQFRRSIPQSIFSYRPLIFHKCGLHVQVPELHAQESLPLACQGFRPKVSHL